MWSQFTPPKSKTSINFLVFCGLWQWSTTHSWVPVILFNGRTSTSTCMSTSTSTSTSSSTVFRTSVNNNCIQVRTSNAIIKYGLLNHQCHKLYPLYWIFTECSTEVQIELEIRNTSICILNRSGIFPVCFEGKVLSNFIGLD